MNKILLSKVEVTCAGCPCQLDMWDVSGGYYYFRYRHGMGYISHDEVTLYEWDGDHYLDGILTAEEVVSILDDAGFELDDTTERVNFTALEWDGSAGDFMKDFMKSE